MRNELLCIKSGISSCTNAINKGGHSKSVNMQRYMYQSSTDSSRETAITTTATPPTNDAEIQDQQQLLQQWGDPNGSLTCLRNH